MRGVWERLAGWVALVSNEWGRGDMAVLRGGCALEGERQTRGLKEMTGFESDATDGGLG